MFLLGCGNNLQGGLFCSLTQFAILFFCILHFCPRDHKFQIVKSFTHKSIEMQTVAWYPAFSSTVLSVEEVHIEKQ